MCSLRTWSTLGFGTRWKRKSTPSAYVRTRTSSACTTICDFAFLLWRKADNFQPSPGIAIPGLFLLRGILTRATLGSGRAGATDLESSANRLCLAENPSSRTYLMQDPSATLAALAKYDTPTI